MADIHINEVHTEMEITDSVGALGPAEMKKLVAPGDGATESPATTTMTCAGATTGFRTALMFPI